MARNATTNQRLNGTWTIAQNQTYFTLAAWMRRDSDTIQSVGSTANVNHVTAFAHWSAGDNNFYVAVRNGSNVIGYIVLNSIRGWNHYAMVFDGTQSTNAAKLKAFFNGTQQTLNFIGTIPSTTSNNVDNEQFNINRWIASGGFWGNGGYAEIGAWQEALTAEEISSLAKGLSPSMIRPNKLGMYLPLVREINDIKGHITLTDTNTTVATHPRVYA